MKMLRIFIPLNIIILFTNLVFGQLHDSASSKLLALEYNYFNSTDDFTKTQISLQKLQLFIDNKMESQAECYDECKRINSQLISNSNDKANFYWNAALINMIHKDFQSSRQYLDFYSKVANDTSTAFGLLFILASFEDDEIDLDEISVNASLANLKQCLKEEAIKVKTGGSRYNWTSYFVPGAGMLLKGYYVKGASSFLLNSASTLFVIYLIRQHAIFNAIGVGLLTVMKFYMGNLAYTKKLVAKREFREQLKHTDDCHNELNQLLIKNSIQFR